MTVVVAAKPHSDPVESADVAGGVQLGINSKGERLKHWFETLKKPDQEFRHWHILSAELTPEVYT